MKFVVILVVVAVCGSFVDLGAQANGDTDKINNSLQKLQQAVANNKRDEANKMAQQIVADLEKYKSSISESNGKMVSAMIPYVKQIPSRNGDQAKRLTTFIQNVLKKIGGWPELKSNWNIL